nr:aldo/keto reductase [Butyrivibrio sp.]
MKYRKDKNGNDISQLGYGCMRFTKKGTAIDYEKTEKEILHAIDQGINYFDTAYIYPGSEECLGRILDENKCREKVHIATKLPQYLMR